MWYSTAKICVQKRNSQKTKNRKKFLNLVKGSYEKTNKTS